MCTAHGIPSDPSVRNLELAGSFWWRGKDTTSVPLLLHKWHVVKAKETDPKRQRIEAAAQAILRHEPRPVDLS